MMALDAEPFNSGSTEGSEIGQHLNQDRKSKFEKGDRVIVVEANAFDYHYDDAGHRPDVTRPSNNKFPMAGCFGFVLDGDRPSKFVSVLLTGASGKGSMYNCDETNWHFFEWEITHAD